MFWSILNCRSPKKISVQPATIQYLAFSPFTWRQSNTKHLPEHHRLWECSFLIKGSQPSGDHWWERKEEKSLGLMLQVTHSAFLENKIILTARLPDLFHHRLNPQPGHHPWISLPAIALIFAKSGHIKYPGFSVLYVHLMKINNSQALVFCQRYAVLFFCCALGTNATTFRIHECNRMASWSLRKF